MKTFSILSLICTFLFLSTAIFAQGVGINESGDDPHPSAMLDVQSQTKGLLIPRMTETQRNAIPAPATGLMVYQTTGTTGFYYYNGAAWQQLAAGGGAPGGNWAAYGNHIFNTNTGGVGIGIGNNAPEAKLEIANDHFNNHLLLNGGTNGVVSSNWRTKESDLYWSDFKITGYNNFNGKRQFVFSHYEFDSDFVLLRNMLQLTPDSDTTMYVGGQAEFDGRIHATGARFTQEGEDMVDELVSIRSESPALFGLHIDMNNETFPGTAIAAHAIKEGMAIEAWSEKGTAGQFTTSEGGKSLITEGGKVGFGTYEPSGEVTIKDQDFAADLVMESNTNNSIALRVGDAENYEEVSLRADGSSLDINKIAFTSSPLGAASSIVPIVSFGKDAAVAAKGDITFDGELNDPNRTGDANLAPIAYGMVRSSGSMGANTGNVSAVWNNTIKRYEITIDDEYYYYLNYITQVTPVSSGRTVTTSSSNGKLLVYMRNSNGNLVPGIFQFTTFKP